MNQSENATRVPVPGSDKGGAWVRMSDKEYKVAPLNFRALRELAGSIKVLQTIKEGEMPNAEQMETLVKIAHSAIHRNYPEITIDEVAEGLDFGNFSSVLSAVMGVAGLLGREAPSSGEVVTSP